MGSKKLYVGMKGVKLIVHTNYDLSNATKVYLSVKKPDGTEVEWDGTVENTSDIVYVIVDGDLDQTGFYAVQAVAEFGAETLLIGETTGFYVYGRYS